jgi:hypothetical protein
VPDVFGVRVILPTVDLIDAALLVLNSGAKRAATNQTA